MGITFGKYGQERDLIATVPELEIFEIIKELSGEEDMRLTRKSDEYLTAVIGEWDVVRIKYSPRAKWIFFPVLEQFKDRRFIESPDEVREMGHLVEESLKLIHNFL